MPQNEGKAGAFRMDGRLYPALADRELVGEFKRISISESNSSARKGAFAGLSSVFQARRDLVTEDLVDFVIPPSLQDNKGGVNIAARGCLECILGAWPDHATISTIENIEKEIFSANDLPADIHGVFATEDMDVVRGGLLQCAVSSDHDEKSRQVLQYAIQNRRDLAEEAYRLARKAVAVDDANEARAGVKNIQTIPDGHLDLLDSSVLKVAAETAFKADNENLYQALCETAQAVLEIRPELATKEFVDCLWHNADTSKDGPQLCALNLLGKRRRGETTS